MEIFSDRGKERDFDRSAAPEEEAEVGVLAAVGFLDGEATADSFGVGTAPGAGFRGGFFRSAAVAGDLLRLLKELCW